MRKQRHKQSRGALPRVSTQSMSQPGGLTLEFADITSVFAYLLFFSPVCEFNLFIQINLYTESMELNKTFWGTHQPQENSSCAHGIHCIEIQIGQGSPLWWSLSRVSKSQRKPIKPNPSGYASENVRGLEIALGVNSQSHLQLGPTQGWRVFHTCTKPAMVWACCCVRLVLPPCHLTSILALAFIPGLGSLPLVHPCPLTRDVVVLEKKKKLIWCCNSETWSLVSFCFSLFPHRNSSASWRWLKVANHTVRPSGQPQALEGNLPVVGIGALQASWPMPRDSASTHRIVLWLLELVFKPKQNNELSP